MSRNLLNKTAPSGRIQAVTPSDTTTYSPPLYGIYVGGAGAVAVVAAETGNSVTFSAVPVGTILPIQVSKVLSTGTTATNLVGLGN